MLYKHNRVKECIEELKNTIEKESFDNLNLELRTMLT